MKIFVTGGNGFIGSHVVRNLVARGDELRCLVRETSDTSRIDQYEWERFVGDVRDPESMREGVRGCDAVIHLASPSSWNDIDSPHMAAIVEDGTQNVLDAAYDEGNIRVVYCSSVIAINGTDRPVIQDETSAFTLTDPTMVYAQSKNRAEELCDAVFASREQDVVTVNPAEVYGPNDHDFVTAGNLVDFATSWPVLVTRGGTSVVHVDDVAEGIVAALDKGRSGERYILGGDNLTIRELAELTLTILGKKKPILRFPTSFINGLTAVATTLRLPLPYNPLVIPYATKYWLMDNSKATQELGVTFRPPAAVLEPTLDWLRAEGHI
jgi:dihydroflavonol-4-reductase